MTKKRRLTSGQQVIIIYDSKIGYCQEPANFLKYERKNVGEAHHDIPIFEKNEQKISGLECFWVLPEDLKTQESIQKIQYEIVAIQVAASCLSKEFGYDIPKKIKDKEIELMANEKFDQLQSMIKKLGYDPRDESWIEKELAETKRERSWFAFERQNPALFLNTWSDMSKIFNKQYGDNISVEDAKNLSKKRTRYLLGSLHTRMGGNSRLTDWKESAKKFEQTYKEIENRMITWSLSKHGKFPLVKTNKAVKFTAGSFFHKCIEKIPHYFKDSKINEIKENIILRVVSYDIETKHIKLDFISEIRRILRGEETENTQPWVSSDEDYIFWLKPEEVDASLIMMESL